MKREQLRINQLTDDAFAWYLDYLSAMDAQDVARYGGFLDAACSLSFNNEPATVTKDGILERLGRYWKNFRSIEHELLNIYGNSQNFMLEALNHYVRLDGRPVTCRAVALTDRNDGGLVTSVRLYTDVSALFT